MHFSNHCLCHLRGLLDDLRLSLGIFAHYLCCDVVSLILNMGLFGLDPCLVQSGFLHLVLLLEANLIIKRACHEIRRHTMLGNSWLTRLSIQKVIGRACESCLLGLVSWCILWMLKVNKCAAEVRLCSESCCLFQRYITKLSKTKR